jgi:hypothetical protein
MLDSARAGSMRDIAPVKVPVDRSARSRARWPSTFCTAFSALAAAARARSAMRIGWLRPRAGSADGMSAACRRSSPAATALVTASSIEAAAGRRGSVIRPGTPGTLGKLRGSAPPRPRRDTGVSNSGGAGSAVSKSGGPGSESSGWEPRAPSEPDSGPPCGGGGGRRPPIRPPAPPAPAPAGPLAIEARLKRTVSSRRTSSTLAPNAGGGPRSPAGELSAARNTRGRPSAPMNSDENSGISPSRVQVSPVREIWSSGRRRPSSTCSSTRRTSARVKLSRSAVITRHGGVTTPGSGSA